MSNLVEEPKPLNGSGSVNTQALLNDFPGKLAIIGGRLEDDNSSIYGELHRLCGGRILVFPTASGEPAEVGAEQVQVFAQHGFEAELVGLVPETADWMPWDSQTIQRVLDFGSVFFTGGDQAQIVAALAPSGKETPLLQALRKAHANGGLISGSSAGAAMMSEIMILGGTSLEAMVHGVTQDPAQPGLLLGKGLTFFPHGVVDQHFIKRGRLGRLITAMLHSGTRIGYGIDENTALLVENGIGRVLGEYGIMVVQAGDGGDPAQQWPLQDWRLSYLDRGDAFDLRSLEPQPAPDKQPVGEQDYAYRAPSNGRRNIFGAYAIYDVMARLVLADPSQYVAEQGEAIDLKAGVAIGMTLRRQDSHCQCLIAKPETGLRMTATGFSLSVQRTTGNFVRAAAQARLRFGSPISQQAQLLLLGSSPLAAGGDALLQNLKELLPPGPVGVFAAASATPGRTAREHVQALTKAGIQAIDLGISIDTIDYADRDAERLAAIAGLSSILFCGGNQIRLIDTLLHRGEESGVLRAMAHAYAQGAALIGASGAASAFSCLMMAGGSTSEALRYGVTSDLGHPGLVIQEGLGFFAGGLIDQNLIDGERLGRLIVACAEENERFGIGICEQSALSVDASGQRLEARGRYGWVLVEVDPDNLSLQGDCFVAKNLRISLIEPGDVVLLGDCAQIQRHSAPAAKQGPAANILHELHQELLRHHNLSKGIQVASSGLDAGSFTLEISSPRDDFF